VASLSVGGYDAGVDALLIGLSPSRDGVDFTISLRDRRTGRRLGGATVMVTARAPTGRVGPLRALARASMYEVLVPMRDPDDSALVAAVAYGCAPRLCRLAETEDPERRRDPDERRANHHLSVALAWHYSACSTRRSERNRRRGVLANRTSAGTRRRNEPVWVRQHV
jgi:hypothetical protein